MRNAMLTIALAAGAATFSLSQANALPAVGTNPAPQSSGVQTVQEFGIYIGPGYRSYRDPYWDYGYGYGYGYRPNYYYFGPQYYGPQYYGYRGSRAWRRLDRRAP
jgi:hypothetical protein